MRPVGNLAVTCDCQLPATHQLTRTQFQVVSPDLARNPRLNLAMNPNTECTVTAIGNDPVHVALAGEFDASTAAMVRKRLQRISTGAVEFDLSQVTFIDTEGIKPIITAARTIRANNGRVIVNNWSKQAQRLRDLLLSIERDPKPFADSSQRSDEHSNGLIRSHHTPAT